MTETPPVIQRPFPWARAITLTLAIVVGLFVAHSVATNENFRWDVIGGNLFGSTVLAGLMVTIILTVVVMVVSTLLGIVLATMRLSRDRVLSGISAGYVVVFRSIPMLAMLLVFYNFAALYPSISIGIPFGPTFGQWDTNTVITPLVAASVGLIMHEAAYTTEVIRAGILSVDRGQREAALAMGMHDGMVFRRVVLPQAMRIIVPPLGNLTIALMKATSLVSVIAVTDLLHAVQLIYSNNYQTIPLLLVACIWYFVLTSVLSLVQSRIERKLARSERGTRVSQSRLVAAATEDAG